MTYCVVFYEANNIFTAYFDSLDEVVVFLGHLHDDGIKFKVINLLWKETKNDV